MNCKQKQLELNVYEACIKESIPTFLNIQILDKTDTFNATI